MKSNRLATHFHKGAGFCPLVICPGWQVSQLNDCEALHADTLAAIEKHDDTDEVFVLVKGESRLVIAHVPEHGAATFDCVAMEQGITYNVPRSVWHAISTAPGAQVMIVERDRTHVDGVARRTLTGGERKALRALLRAGASPRPDGREPGKTDNLEKGGKRCVP